MRTLAPVLIVAAALVACARTEPVPGPGFSVATIRVEDDAHTVELDVEVAADGAARALGLMFRQDLPAGRGMLFLYPRPGETGHWMKNTYVPLDIAYADDTGTIFEIVAGRPLDTTVLRPAAPYLYVLEVPSGWFAANGFGPGTKLNIPPGLPAPR